MKTLQKIKFLFIAWCIFTLSILPAETELLKTSDVSKVMQQIFQQHVEKKEMTGSILKNSFRIYIDQFDPFRMYLLEEETLPYLNLTPDQMNAIVQQYKYDDFSAFSKLNDTIQKAILRARALRAEILQDKSSLFNTSATENSSNEEWDDPDLNLQFPKNQAELKQRIKQHLMYFIAGEKLHFGNDEIMKNQDKTLAIYDHFLEGQENAYLFDNEQGQPLSAKNKENLFIMHVLKALASSLDAHTTFYNNVEAYNMKVRLEKAFEGIGIALQLAPDGTVLISQVMDGGPAAKSGQVQAQDRILSINGTPTKGLSLEKIMEYLRGQNDTPVTLVLERENGDHIQQQFQVTLKREPIALNEDRVDTSYEKFGDGIIGKITLHAFYQGEKGINSENDVRKAIKDLSQKGPLRGLILDLRENSGGFLTQAVKVAGLFITNGVVVISKYSNGTEHFYRDMDGKIAYRGPLVILTSKATASAAEIVAQSLQDYGVALVVGDEHTYGKGTIQSQTVTDDKASSYFKVTVGKYYTVSGKTPQLRGVKADIVVPGPFSAEHIGEKYLEYTIPSDKIPQDYNDDLSDVDPGLKTWYLRYYMPTLQHRMDNWTNLLPTLRTNSAYRLSHNSQYQAFVQYLNGLKHGNAGEISAFNGKKNYGADELQMAEAVNIVKDMISLQAQGHTNSFGNTISGPLENFKK